MQTLSERLVHALRQVNLTQAELARRVDVKPQVINFLCRSKTLKSKMTYNMADAMGISGEWLACGSGVMIEEEDPNIKLINNYREVPIIEYIDLITLLNKNSAIVETWPQEQNTSHLLTTVDTGVRGFAIKQQDKSMHPLFDTNTFLVINPDREPKENEFVLAYIKIVNAVILRQFHQEDKLILLSPINHAMYKSTELRDGDFIVGTLIEARWQL